MKRRMIIIGAVVLFVAVCGLIAFRWASAPVEEAVTFTTVSHKQSVPQQTVDVARFSFAVPADFAKQQRDATADSRYNLILSQSRTGGMRVVITADALPADGLTGISDYNLRQKVTDTYAPLSLTKPLANSAAFHKIKGTSEVSLFWQQNDQYVSIVVTGSTASEEQLTELLQSIASSWHWK